MGNWRTGRALPPSALLTIQWVVFVVKRGTCKYLEELIDAVYVLLCEAFKVSLRSQGLSQSSRLLLRYNRRSCFPPSRGSMHSRLVGIVLWVAPHAKEQHWNTREAVPNFRVPLIAPNG